jgi:anti-repressor protein
MNDLKIFENKEFGEIRTVNIDGEPWFVGKDVAEILGYSNTKDAISTHIDEDDRTVIQRSHFPTFDIPTRGLTLINESGLYSLILGSKLPNAKRFKRWVTSEVLPSIRKNGGYIAGQETMTDDELMARALQVAQNKIQERDKQIETMKPKAIFADAVAASHTSILIGDLAKLISQNGVNIGQKRLFKWLRDNGYLIKREGSDRNMPTQRSMEMKLFEVKESTISNPDGSVRITRTPKVTGKGQQYFVNKFLAI